MQRAEDPVISPRGLPEKVKHERRRDDRHRRQPPTPGIAVVVKHRESDPGIRRVCEVQKSGDHLDVAVKPQPPNGPSLRRLVHHEDPARDGQVPKLPQNVFLIHRLLSLGMSKLDDAARYIGSHYSV
jgi:hypothetical protein